MPFHVIEFSAELYKTEILHAALLKSGFTTNALIAILKILGTLTRNNWRWSQFSV